MRLPGFGTIALVIVLWLDSLRKPKREKAPSVIPTWMEEEVRRRSD